MDNTERDAIARSAAERIRINLHALNQSIAEAAKINGMRIEASVAYGCGDAQWQWPVVEVSIAMKL